MHNLLFCKKQAWNASPAETSTLFYRAGQEGNGDDCFVTWLRKYDVISFQQLELFQTERQFSHALLINLMKLAIVDYPALEYFLLYDFVCRHSLLP